MSDSTVPLVAAGLVGGYAVARFSGIRPLGGVVLAAAGIGAGKRWAEEIGPGAAVGLGAAYLGAFGASHPLAKKIGAWQAVAVATAAAAGLTALVESRS